MCGQVFAGKFSFECQIKPTKFATNLEIASLLRCGEGAGGGRGKADRGEGGGGGRPWAGGGEQ